MMRTWKMVFVPLLLAVLLPVPERADAGGRILRASSDPGGGGPYINLIVREVRVTPIVAHVGDVIRIEMVVENRGDNANDTVPAEIRANGKVVARKLFTYGFRDVPGFVSRETFLWNTGGYSPGDYRIRGEVFLWYDASEFDNFLNVTEPLVLLPAGDPLPQGRDDGGTAVTADPRWRPVHRTDSGASQERGGY